MKNIKIFLRNHFLSLSIIFGVTFLVWGKILNQTFMGEGYFYFESWRSFISPTIGIKILSSYDNFGRLFFDIAIPIFRDNLFLYQLFALLTSALIYSSLYYILYKITKEKLFALTAALLWASNYIGTFEMLAEGNYDRFVQRIPNTLPALFALYFLFLYLKKNKLKDLLTSLILFALAVFLAHFTTIFMPIFILLPFSSLLGKKVTKKEILKAICIAILFFMLNFIQVKLDPYQPQRSFSKFLHSDNNLAVKMLYQIPAIVMPHETIKLIGKNLFENAGKEPYLPVVQVLTPIFIVSYLALGILVYRRQKKFFILYITIALSLLSGILLYFYSDDKLNPLKELAQGRQYYIFEMYIAIWTAILLKTLSPNQKVYRLLSTILIVIFISWNTTFVWKDIKALDYEVKAMKTYTSYIKTLIPKFTDKTVVISKSSIHWPNDMLQRVYSPPKWRVALSLSELEKIPSKDINDTYVIDYDFGLDPTEEPKAEKGRLVDLTDKYRAGKVNISSW